MEFRDVTQDLKKDLARVEKAINERVAPIELASVKKALSDGTNPNINTGNSKINTTNQQTKAGLKNSQEWRLSTTVKTFKQRLSATVIENLSIHGIPYIFMKNLYFMRIKARKEW